MTKELKTPRESDGVLFNINPRITLFTTALIDERRTKTAIDEVDGVDLHSYGVKGKGIAITLNGNRITLSQITEIRDNCIGKSERDIYDTTLTTVDANIEIEGLFTGFEPIIRGKRVRGDVAVEIDNNDITRQEIRSETSPSSTVTKARGKYIITSAFPTSVTIEEPDSAGYPRRISEDFDIPESDITFGARTVVTELSDFIK